MKLLHIAALLALCVIALPGQTPTSPISAPAGPGAFLLRGGQSTTLSLQVTTRAGVPRSGDRVTFVAPQDGPSGQFAGASPETPFLVTALTGGNGIATASFTAGNSDGLFLVAAYVNGTPASATFAFSITSAIPPPTLSAASAANAVRTQILANATLDERLQLHGPFLVPAGSEIHPSLAGNPYLYIQSLPVKKLSWFFWIDDAPRAGFAHGSRYVLLDATQTDVQMAVSAARVLTELWWPEVVAPDGQALYPLQRPVPPGRAINAPVALDTAIPPASSKLDSRRFEDAPADACAIVVIGPGLPGAADDASKFIDYLTSNSLVQPGNIIGKFKKVDGSVQSLPITRADLERYVKKAVDKGCKKIYLMISTHGGEADAPSPGIKVLQSQAAGLNLIPYADLHTVLAPLQGVDLTIFENSCFSGQVADWLQGWGFKGQIITSADGQHTSYSEAGTGSFFFDAFLPLLNGGAVQPADALKTLNSTPQDDKVTKPNPQVITLRPDGARQTAIPFIFLADKGGTKQVRIDRPQGTTGDIAVTIQPAGGIGHFSKASVTIPAGQNSVTVDATADDTGSTQWTIQATDASGQTFIGSNIFQVGQFHANLPVLTVPLGGSADEVVVRFGPDIDRGDVVLKDTSDVFEVTSADGMIAMPAQASITVAKGQTEVKITAKGNKIGTTTFTVKNKRGFAQSFTVQVVAPANSSGISCPDSSSLWDVTALVVQNVSMHPIPPAAGKWQFMRMGSAIMLSGPNNIKANGTMDGACKFSATGPYSIFGFSTRVDIMNGFFVPLPGASGSNKSERAASDYAGIQFDYAIGRDGGLPTGEPITFRAQGVLLCSYAVTPSTSNITAGGGAGLLSVVTDSPCPWTPVASAPWITIGTRTPAGSARGNGTVAYTVAPNLTAAARTGTIAVAGQFSATITQDAGNSNRPAVTAAVNGASFTSGFTSGAWVTIKGQNLAMTTRVWQGSDFTGDRLPVSLSGVSVTINGKPAFVYFISPAQLNVLAPAERLEGSLAVQVTNASGSSDLFVTTRSNLNPALFLFDPENRRYAAAVLPDGTYAGREDLFGGAAAARPAIAGDVISLYGTGFGDTTPAIAIDRTVAAPAPIASAVVARIGGVNAPVTFAGLVSPGLYQINVVVPGVEPGDRRVEIYVDGIPIQDAVYVTVGAAP